jgi:hypothetical protein
MTASFERVQLDARLSPQNCPNQACFKEAESVVASLCGAAEANFGFVLKVP